MRNKAQKWVFEAPQHVVAAFPFTIKGIDSVVLGIPPLLRMCPFAPLRQRVLAHCLTPALLHPAGNCPTPPGVAA